MVMLGRRSFARSPYRRREAFEEKRKARPAATAAAKRATLRRKTRRDENSLKGTAAADRRDQHREHVVRQPTFDFACSTAELLQRAGPRAARCNRG